MKGTRAIAASHWQFRIGCRMLGSLNRKKAVMYRSPSSIAVVERRDNFWGGIGVVDNWLIPKRRGHPLAATELRSWPVQKARLRGLADSIAPMPRAHSPVAADLWDWQAPRVHLPDRATPLAKSSNLTTALMNVNPSGVYQGTA